MAQLYDYQGKAIKIEGTGGSQTTVIQKFEGGGGTCALALRNLLPSYYLDYPANPASYEDDSWLDSRIAKVPDGKRFMFLTDTHWDLGMNAKLSPTIMQYVKERLNIPLVIFGGDVINRNDTKYIANQTVSSFGNICRSAFGNDFMAIFGNHDINCSNLDDELIAEHPVEERYLPCNITYQHLFKGNKRDADLWETCKDQFLQIAEDEHFTEDEILALEYECRMNYYYDDTVNKIRYIVTKCRTGGGYTSLNKLFGEEFIYKYEWLYNVIHDTPEGYDLIYATHMVDTWPGDLDDLTATKRMSNYESLPIALLMGRKLKVNKKTYVSHGSDNAWKVYPYTTRYFDFTDCKDIKNVFVLVGHVHKDLISVAYQDTEFATQIKVRWFQGENIDQITCAPNNGVEIPIISTTTDAWRQSNIWTMVKDTVTEQAFDVFVLQDSSIRVSRFGVGADREVNFRTD